MGTVSTGARLYADWGIRQGSYLIADEFPGEWLEYRAVPELRAKGLKKGTVLLVQSQNCDITAKDIEEPEVELLPLDPIKPKKVYHRNQYAQSSRTLQIEVDGQYRQGRVRATLVLPKVQLLEWLQTEEPVKVAQLSPENLRTLVTWKANRYQRTALPDRFNQVFTPLFARYADELGRQTNEQNESYVRALYLFLDNLEETGSYQFALLALLRHNTPDHVRLGVDEQIEELTQELELSKGFTLADLPGLPGNAEREDSVTVAQLTQYLKINLDYLSLREGDGDLGPELI